MGYCNSVAYVQRQMDIELEPYKAYARIYVDDLFIFSDSLSDHVTHLNAVMSRLAKLRITLNPVKSYIGFPTVKLLGQKVNALGLAAAQDKLDAIASLEFPRTLKDLEIYLGLTGWLPRPRQLHRTKLMSLRRIHLDTSNISWMTRRTRQRALRRKRTESSHQYSSSSHHHASITSLYFPFQKA
jgi:hypothetical protein